MQTAQSTVDSHSTAERRKRTGADRSAAAEHAVLVELPAVFTPREARYISKVLTRDELRVISDRRDALVIARIKRMPPRRLAHFDGYIPCDAADRKFYCAIQRQWLCDEEYLLGTRLGRSPTAKELFIDFMNNHNGLRFRAFFSLKFASRVKLCTPPKAAPRPCCEN